MQWLPERWFRPRGWLLLAVGALTLLFAAVLGRRDLLVAGIFMVILPIAASAGLRFFAPGFTVSRVFSPAFAEAGTTTTVTVEVRGSTPGGASARITEQLPPRFIDVPRFEYPRPVSAHSLVSRYSYTMQPNHRGVFTIGPLTATFGDPFDVALLARSLDQGDALTVAPAIIQLPLVPFIGGRGQDGSQMTRQQANPSNDDVMTREYRHGDPFRRVHWPATARQGKLMVRAEDSVATPEATLILDQRPHTYGSTAKSAFGKDFLHSSPAFEWAVTATASISSHLLERGYSLRVLDDAGAPAFTSSPSAPDPHQEDFAGQVGTFEVAQSLAALELSQRPDATSTKNVPSGLGETLVDQLFAARRRGPVVVVTGLLTKADARVLSAAINASEGAFALLVCPDVALAEDSLGILHQAGWRAVAATPSTALAQAWIELDAGTSAPSAPSSGARRGAGQQ
ncbi:DUF58 domain-containing protein [Arthrobacter cryoconiti]|uniref:DUF58 domain-containing protein n=1 Tax=Arthrobacter cryoconiti TaxID=748907 RepID=A0ABV8R308_9MICC|nr:DUF58 domain-containing protein [Arthrobacter cryoconiti]MCC9066993.1 DUF58 domain-containing protein [Arthrobacter cryoconiti]